MAKKINVVPNESLVGKLVTMLDGSRDKIVEASARSYKMRDRRKALPANCLAREGQTFFEVTAESVAEVSDKVKVRDGYVVMPKVEEPKSTRGGKGGKKEETPEPKNVRGGRGNKKTVVEVDQDDEYEEEVPVSKKTVVSKMVVTSLISQSSSLREKMTALLQEVLAENFENFVSVGVAVTVEDPNAEGALNNRLYVTADIEFDIPEDEILDEEDELDEEVEAFEFSDETLGRVVDGLWQKQVDKQAPIVMKVYEALQLETEEEQAAFTIGSRLVDEDDRVFYFAGLQRDPAPRLIVESEDGETLDLGSKDFVSLEFKPVIAEEYEEELEEEDQIDEEDQLDDEELVDGEESDDDSILSGCDTREEAEEVLEELTEKQLRAFIYDNIELGDDGSEEFEANASYVDESDSEDLIEFILDTFYPENSEDGDDSEEDGEEEADDEVEVDDEVEEVEEEADDEFSYSEEDSEEFEEEEEQEDGLTEADVLAMTPEQIIELLDENEIPFNGKMRNVKHLKAERTTFNKFKGWVVKQLKAAQVL